MCRSRSPAAGRSAAEARAADHLGGDLAHAPPRTRPTRDTLRLGPTVTGFTEHGGALRWACPLCPWVTEAPGTDTDSSTRLSRRKHQHLARYHADRLGMLRDARKQARNLDIQWAPAETLQQRDVFWRCPLCEQCIVRSSATDSYRTVCSARLAHGENTHGMDRRAWVQCLSRARRDASSRRQQSVRQIAWALPGRIMEAKYADDTGGHALVTFMYPKYTTAPRRTHMLARRWMCQTCRRIDRNPKALAAVSCDTPVNYRVHIARDRAVAALRRNREQPFDGAAGMTDAEWTQVYQRALELMEGDRGTDAAARAGDRRQP